MLRAETSLARGDPAALSDARAAVQLLHDQASHDGSSQDQSSGLPAALRVLGQALHRHGQLTQAEAVLLDGAARTDPSDHRGALDAVCALAALRLEQNRGDEAARLVAGALGSAGALPTSATGHALALLGDCRLAQERWEDAERAYARAGELLARIGDEPGRVGLLARTGWLRHRLGDSAAGEALLRDAVTRLRRLDRGHDHARTLHRLGLLYRDRDRHREAATALQDAATQLTAQHARHLALLALTDLGDVHRTLSEPLDAAAIRTQADALRAQLALPEPHPSSAPRDRRS